MISMSIKSKWYCWAALASVTTFALLAWEMNRELNCWANKDYLTLFFFPLGVAVLVFSALNLKFMKPMVKKYNRRMIFGMVAYVLALGLINHVSIPPAPYKYLLAALPVLPLIYVCFTFIRFVADADEMWRKIYMEAMAFSGVATGFTCLSYLFVRDLGTPVFHAEWAFYLMWLYYLIGLFFSWRRYR